MSWHLFAHSQTREWRHTVCKQMDLKHVIVNWVLVHQDWISVRVESCSFKDAGILTVILAFHTNFKSSDQFSFFILLLSSPRSVHESAAKQIVEKPLLFSTVLECSKQAICHRRQVKNSNRVKCGNGEWTSYSCCYCCIMFIHVIVCIFRRILFYVWFLVYPFWYPKKVSSDFSWTWWTAIPWLKNEVIRCRRISRHCETGAPFSVFCINLQNRNLKHERHTCASICLFCCILIQWFYQPNSVWFFWPR